MCRRNVGSVVSAWGDHDDDGDIDAYIANWGAANKLFSNDGDGTFTEEAGVANDAANRPLSIFRCSFCWPAADALARPVRIDR